MVILKLEQHRHGRARILTDRQGIRRLRGNRTDAGQLAPKGFPRTNRFSAIVSGRKADEET
jgi:hypothetical protein